MMIAVLIAASLASHGATLPPRSITRSTAPSQAVPSLCLTSDKASERPVMERGALGTDNKMSAYQFNARPCRVVGNLECPRQARLQFFRLGEPLRDTLFRNLSPR